MSGIIKEALEYIVGSQQPKIVEKGNWSYSTDPNLKRMNECLRASALTMSTLSGLIDYIKSNTDKMAGENGCSRSITDESTVAVHAGWGQKT